ncbi:MAG: hypothetical protein EBY09_05150 [Verrucomicrobia bacterium]|nr:hypothetical protein [Verrucomicrobiota bacterium]NBU09109.1 hypothetical protein [Pseudomonadota bacterium]NDA66018.1 hypothetical protein [Verrucomicrobiota bacterium]NDD37865.1 hypothetical protein [Verrucomicrobiota bacterium]
MGMKRIGGWLLALGLAQGVALTAAERFDSVYLSEFLTINRAGLRDDDGDHSGWIELHNGGTSPVNLAGWSLTDARTNLTRWRFPGLVLLPDKYLLVFASAKDRTKDLAHLHTNFKLAPEGSYLALVNPQGAVVSEFAPTPAVVDVSVGRVRGEPTWLGNFHQPTPGKPNASGGPGFAPEVAFSHPGGNFTEPFTLSLSPGPATNAVIRYTLDGSLPTQASPVWNGPLNVTNTIQVRARAYQTGLLPGPPHSEVYLRLATNALTFTSTLPVLVLHSRSKDIPGPGRSAPVQFSFFEPLSGTTSLTNPPTLTTRGGFHTRGSSSSGMPQASFAVHFYDAAFDEERKRSPLGLPAESDWVLYAPNSFDPVLFHNPFIHQLSRDMGRYSSRTRFVEVFLTSGTNALQGNSYHGLYVLEEKIKISKRRVNLDHVSAEDLEPPNVTGGYIFKIDRTGPGESGFGAGGTTVVHVDPKEATLRLPQRQAQLNFIHSYFRDFDRALQGPKWKDPEVGYPAFFDVPAAIDFHVLEVLSGNVDAIVLSTYFHKPRNGKLTFGPHWDFDRALGSTDGRDDNPRQWNTGPFFSGPWWPRLFTDPDFWQLWVDRWQELRQTHFSVTNLHALADRFADELRDAQPRQYKRWNFQPRGGSYQSELKHMKTWLSNRVDFVDQQLTPRPQMLPPTTGSALEIQFAPTSTNTTIYYTLDGLDPRLPQGAIRTNALTYAGPIALSPNARLIARAHNPKQRQSGGPPISTPWSGPVTADR